MKIALDYDNTINANRNSSEFFRVLTHLLIPEHQIYIITDREKGTEEKIKRELKDLGISFSHLVITEKKTDYIRQNRIQILFENEDEYFIELGEEVVVFKIREEGNFSFAEKKWIGSKKTTKIID